MAIDMVTIPKPQIWLYGATLEEGASVNSNSLYRVDHAKHLPPTSTLSINGVSLLNKSDILTFYRRVRIIITGQQNPKPIYMRKQGELSALEFEGSYHLNDTNQVNDYAETYFTLNGKDPIQSKKYLYNFSDTDNLDEYLSTGSPSAAYDSTNNANILGFLFTESPTGNGVTVIKARTYYSGLSSRIAVAYFKVATGSSNLEFIKKYDK